MTPRKSSIAGLLGHYERRPIKLPEFQRPYSWEKAQRAAFWADLIAFKERFDKNPVSASYFLGPVVVIENKEEITILDGQQRLATATILLAVLRDLARELNATHPDQELDYFARDVQKELIEKKDTNPLVYSLTLSELDEPFFPGTKPRSAHAPNSYPRLQLSFGSKSSLPAHSMRSAPTNKHLMNHH